MVNLVINDDLCDNNYMLACKTLTSLLTLTAMTCLHHVLSGTPVLGSEAFLVQPTATVKSMTVI